MITELDLNKLIKETQTLCHDERIEMAAMGKRIVQEMESESGDFYELSIVLTLKIK